MYIVRYVSFLESHYVPVGCRSLYLTKKHQLSADVDLTTYSLSVVIKIDRLTG